MNLFLLRIESTHIGPYRYETVYNFSAREGPSGSFCVLRLNVLESHSFVEKIQGQNE